MSRLISTYNKRFASANEDGFTLVELLIVVAIIAILVGVSIPVYNSYLNGVREKADLANERDALALAHASIMTESLGVDATGNPIPITWSSGEAKAYYVVSGQSKGSLQAADPATAGTSYGQCKNHEGGYIEVTMKKDGDATVAWKGYKAGGSATAHL